MLTLYFWPVSPATRNEFDPDCCNRYSFTLLALPSLRLRASACSGSSWLGLGFLRAGPRGDGGREDGLLTAPPGLGAR